MSYNKFTDWENEREYLDNLSKTGNAGERAWAEAQKKVLAQAELKYGDTGKPTNKTTTTTTTPTTTTSPYNENTNWANEQAYLDNLSKTGNAGEQAWANNQMNVLADAAKVYGGSTSTPVQTGNAYTPTGTHNDAGLPADAQAEIDALKEAYAAAIAGGDTAGAEAAHQAAEAIRSGYGYSGGEDGSEYIELVKPEPVINVPVSTSLDSSAIASWDDNYNKTNAQPTYTSKYDPQIEAKLNEILTREDFSYDVENDPLYSQYRTMYNREGDRAMREALAEAAAGAGGMNTYAIAAAQQARNYYASQLNDRIPELYQLAYEMYLQDKESKIQDLGLLTEMDDKQYNRYRDTMADWRADKDFAYGSFKDAVSQGNWEKTFEYDQKVGNRDYLYTDYWAEKEWTASEQDKAKDEVWNLISLGVTPSAELIAKSGMSQTDIELAVAAVNAGNGNNNGYTPKDNPDGNDDDEPKNNGYTPDTTPVTPTQMSIADIERDLNGYIANGASKSEINEYLRSAKQSGVITQAQYDQLKAIYAPKGHLY